MRLATSFILSLLLLIAVNACTSSIEPKNRICTIAKITTGLVLSKGGRKTYSYFYRGRLYTNTAAFDARYFTYGDMFLIYIDKTNPGEHENLKNVKKINSSSDFEKVDSIDYYLDQNDLNRLDSIF